MSNGEVNRNQMGVGDPWEAHMYWLRERGEARPPL